MRFIPHLRDRHGIRGTFGRLNPPKCETASQGLQENGVQRNASRFETEKNDNIPLVTFDPFSFRVRDGMPRPSYGSPCPVVLVRAAFIERPASREVTK
jgi:hypothetical protein